MWTLPALLGVCGIAQATLCATASVWLPSAGRLTALREGRIIQVGPMLSSSLLVLHARSLNALLVSDETAATLGVDLGRFRRQLFVLCALLTGVVVAVAGGIGFVFVHRTGSPIVPVALTALVASSSTSRTASSTMKPAPHLSSVYSTNNRAQEIADLVATSLTSS